MRVQSWFMDKWHEGQRDVVDYEGESGAVEGQATAKRETARGEITERRSTEDPKGCWEYTPPSPHAAAGWMGLTKLNCSTAGGQNKFTSVVTAAKAAEQKKQAKQHAG